MERKLKFIHTADVHLDSTFAERDSKKASARRGILRGTFTSLVTFAKMNDIHLVLIAGDLFDSDMATKDTVIHLKKLFESNPDIIFVITPGNHDANTKNSVYACTEFPENVIVFKNDYLECVTIEKLGVDIYGYAFTSQYMENNPLLTAEVNDNDRIKILVAHGDLDTYPSSYCPLSSKDFYRLGFDYVALGHVHNSNGIEKLGNCYYGYSGCPEGRHYGECGEKGVVVVDSVKDGDSFKADIRYVKMSHHRYESIDINLNGEKDTEVAYNKIFDECKKYYSLNTSLRINLRGAVSSLCEINESYITEQVGENVFSFEVNNYLSPILDDDVLNDDKTIKGEYYKALLPYLNSGNEKDREVASLALKYGLSALGGNKIEDI